MKRRERGEKWDLIAGTLMSIIYVLSFSLSFPSLFFYSRRIFATRRSYSLRKKRPCLLLFALVLSFSLSLALEKNKTTTKESSKRLASIFRPKIV